MERLVGEQFTDMCEALSLQQHVTQPTHTSGHILDLEITEYDNSFVIIGKFMTHIFGSQCINYRN